MGTIQQKILNIMPSNLQDFFVYATNKSIGSFVIKIVYFALTFLTNVLLGRYLGVYEYGIYVNAFAWYQLLMIPSVFGFNKLLIREVSVYNEFSEWRKLKGVIKFSSLFVLFLSVFIVVFTGFAGWIVFRTKPVMLYTLWMALIIVPIIAQVIIRRAIIVGFKYIIWSQVAEYFIIPVIFLSLILLTKLFFMVKLSAYLTVIYLGVAVITALFVNKLIQRKVMPVAVVESDTNLQVKKWLKSALPMFFIGSMQLLNQRADTIMLGIMASADDVGIYQAASRGAWIIISILAISNMILEPIIASIWTKRDKVKLQVIVRKVALLTFLGSISLWIFIIYWGNDFLLLFGNEFSNGYRALLILSSGLVLNTLAVSVGPLLMMTGYAKDAAIIIGVSAILNILLNIMFIPIYSINGAALSTSLSTLFMNILLGIVVYRRLGINPTVFGFLNLDAEEV